MADNYVGELKIRLGVEADKNIPSRVLKIQQQIDKLEKSIETLKAKREELLKGDIKTKGYAELENQLNVIKKQLEDLNKEKASLESTKGNTETYKKLAEEINKAKDYLRELNAEKETFINSNTSIKEYAEIEKEIKEISIKMEDVNTLKNRLFGDKTVNPEVYKKYEKTLSDLQNRYDELTKKQEQMLNSGNSGKLVEYSKLSETISKANGELDKLAKEQLKDNKAIENSVRKVNNEIIKQQASYSMIEEEMKKMVAEGTAYKPEEQIKKENAGLEQQIQLQEQALEIEKLRRQEQLNKLTTDTTSGGSSQMSKADINKMFSADAILYEINPTLLVVKKAADKMTAIIKKAVNVAGGAIKGLADLTKKAFSKIGDYISSHLSDNLKQFITHGKKSSDIVEKLTKRLVNLAKRVFIWTVITRALRHIRSGLAEAFQEWVRIDDDTNKRVSRLMTSLKQLEYELVSAFAPVINIVAPAFQKIVDVMTEGTNKLGQFFSALEGNDVYKRMIASAENYAESLDDVGKSAKNAKNQLAGFDKVDILGDNNKKSSVATELQKIPEEINNAAGLIKKGKFKDFGTLIADMLRQSLQNINWDDLKKTAKTKGAQLADLINGIFNLPLAQEGGNALAQAINTITEAVNSFVNTIDEIGISSAWFTFWDSVINGIDFDKIAETITTGGNKIVNGLKNFWRQMRGLGDEIGTGITKIFDSIFVGIDLSNLAEKLLNKLDTFNEILLNFKPNWAGIAKNFVTGLKTFFEGEILDENGEVVNVWKRNGQALRRIANGFFETLSNIFQSETWKSGTLGESIANWFNSAMKGFRWEKVGETINGIITGLINSLSQFLENADHDELIRAFDSFIEGLDLTGIKDSLMILIGKIADLLVDAFEGSQAVDNAIKGIGEWILERIKDSVMGMLNTGFIGILTKGIGGLGFIKNKIIAKNADLSKETVPIAVENYMERTNNLTSQAQSDVRQNETILSQLGNFIGNATSEVKLFLDSKEVAEGIFNPFLKTANNHGYVIRTK